MKYPKISVVLPTYNGADFLSHSIDSILNQTMPDFELIVVDDASTDETSVIISNYVKKDKRVRYIRNPVNKHIASSLNNGFKIAQGKYWTWTSDDNLYRSNAFELMAGYLDENPQTHLVYSDWTKLHVVKGTKEYMHFDATPKDILENCIVGPCFMYRAEAAQKVGEYDSNFPLVQDYDYWLRFYQKYSFALLPIDLYIYRLHPKCLTEQKGKQLWSETNRVLDKYIPLYVQRFPELTEQLNPCYQKIIYQHNPNRKSLSLIQQNIGSRATYRFLKELYKRTFNPLFLNHMSILSFRYYIKSFLLKSKKK